MPAVRGIDGATVTSLNDEHATIALPPESTVTIGDRVELLAVARRSHDQPPRRLLCRRGQTVVDIWPIAARGYSSTDSDKDGGAST